MFLDQLLQEINTLPQEMQNSTTNLDYIANILNRTFKSISDTRSQYQKIRMEAEEISQKWKIHPQFTQKRMSKVKSHFDELSTDHRFLNSEERFKLNVFYSTIDIITSQLKNRFKSFSHINEKFNFFFPSVFLNLTVEDIIQKGDALQHFYEKDLAPSLALELAALKNNKMICEDLQSIQNIPQLLKYLINSTGASSFTNVIQALQLYLTLPVSVATAERSFSKLKIIKNFLRNAMI